MPEILTGAITSIPKQIGGVCDTLTAKMNDKTLSIIIKAQDQASKVINDVDDNVGQASSGFASLGKVAGVAAIAIGGATVLAGKFAISAAAEYEQSLNIFRSVSGATAVEMTQVAAKARELGKDISLPGVSAKDASLAMVELAKAGLSVNDTMAASKGVLSLAKAGQLDTAQAAEIAANALNAFNLEGKDAARVADLLAAAANASSAGVGDLALGMQMSSASAAALKIPVDSLVTLLAEMSNNGIKGSDAGTSLKTMMMNLVPSSNKAAGAMKELGLSFFDANGNFVGMREVITQLQDKTKDLTDEERALSLQTIFGSDSVRAANILIKEGVTGYDRMTTAVNKQGAATALAAAQNAGFKGALDALKSSIETIAIDVGMKLLPVLTSMVTAITTQIDPALHTMKTVAEMVFNYLEPKFIALWLTIQTRLIPILMDLWQNVLLPLIPVVGGSLVVAIGEAITALNIVLSGVTWVIKAMQDGNPVIWALVAAFGSLATAMMLGAAFDAIRVAMVTLQMVTIPGTIAQLEALRLFLATPMVMAAVEVGLAIAAIQLVYNKGLQTKQLLDKLNSETASELAGTTAALQQIKSLADSGKITHQKAAQIMSGLNQRASGGPVSAGQPYIVGENEPELFVPNQSGTILNGRQMQAAGIGATTFNMYGAINLSSSDAVDRFFQRLDTQREMASLGVGI